MASARISAYRWWILALLFLATTINYLDRIVFSVLIPAIRDELHLTNTEYGYLTGAFQIAYTAGFLIAGKFIDRFGTRMGYAAAILWWSAAAAFHALARTTFELGFWRAMLGFGESGNFPAAIKAVAEWFPKKDRALATGIFNSGTTLASIIGPPVFVALNLRFGWRTSFVVTAVTGFLWVALWWVMHRNPPRDEEEDKQPQVGWTAALRYPQTWGFALGKFLTDPVWWFYLFWLPPYLFDARSLNLTEIGWALPVVYLVAGFGSVAGGWLSGALIRRGWEEGRARRAALALCAGLMPVTATAVFASHVAVAILLVSLACAAHQGWSANLYTVTSDVFPKQVVASVTGIGGCAGGLGGFLFSAILPGYVVSHFGYAPMFILMGVLHLTALFSMRYLIWGGAAKPGAAAAV